VSDTRKIALVTTTIRVPECLDGDLENAQRHGHAERVDVVVVGDRKSPPATADFLAKLDARHPGRVVWMDVDDQRAFLRRWPALDLTLRWDCIQRRNVGYLRAAADGAGVIVAADDDNFVTGEDYFGHYLRVGTEVEVPVLSHPSGWWNVCERLRSEPPRRFYHRGFPKSKQDWTTGGGETETATVRPVVNAGLWLKTPDVDATTNIEEPIEVVEMLDVAGERVNALAPGTWCPFNSQNTAFDVSVLPAMYLVTMLDTVRQRRIGRMDDIWMSYFVRAIGDRLGGAVTYGPPLVVQDRNPHDYVRDLSEEIAGYELTEWLVERLRAFDTTETTWSGAYLDLIYHLREAGEDDPDLPAPERDYLRQVLLGMAAWHGAVADLDLAGAR